MFHAYPHNLTEVLLEKWYSDRIGLRSSDEYDEVLHDQGAEASVIEELISTCYQTSMLREEERPLRFRLILRDPERFASEEGPPYGLHRLIFKRPRLFNEYELQKLASAGDFYRSLIGVGVDYEEKLQIWGLVHSGPRWVQAIRGGRQKFSPLPQSLVLYVTGPGHITVCKGSTTIAMLNAGKIITPSGSLFDSHWLRERHADAYTEIWNHHQAARSRAKRPWAVLERDFPYIIAQQVFKRIISIVCNSHHGGTIISLSPARASEVLSANCFLSLKYPFREEEPRNRLCTLILKLMNTLAESYGDLNQADLFVGWRNYVTSKDDTLTLLDEAIFEYANFIAGLTAVDGAVVISQRQELMGFGGMILGSLDNKVSLVARSLDFEGESNALEPVDRAGMRHRAVYHLCNEMHDALAIVISQDGGVHIVMWKNGIVTYWDVDPWMLTQFS